MRLLQVEKMSSNNREPTWRDSLTKLWIFNLTDCTRVVYIDSDSMVLQNLDHLFKLDPAFIYSQPAYWLAPTMGQKFFTSVLLVVQPNSSEFDRLLDTDYKRKFDMDIINEEYGNEIRPLPLGYVVLNTDLDNAPEQTNRANISTSELAQKAHIVHFSEGPRGGYGKPWRKAHQEKEK